jgi:hypothetical protein
MMKHKKLNRTLMLLLLATLIFGLTACPPVTTTEEKAAEGTEAEGPVPTEETIAVTEPTAEEKGAKTQPQAEHPTLTEEKTTDDVDTVAPTVISTTPPNGSRDVSPDITEISVTFSEAMMDKSWSWAYEQQDKFPQITGDPGYDASFTINTLPVELEPNKEYEIWINTSQFKNFTDKVGNPATPYKLMFKTKQPDDNILITTDEFEGVIFRDGDWVPTAEEVRTLEKQLATYLPRQQDAFDGSKIPIEDRLPTYKRQYWGVLENEKRVISANFFCDAFHYDWKNQMVMVLDGGDCYFQIQYDVDTVTFFDMYVNGSA